MQTQLKVKGGYSHFSSPILKSHKESQMAVWLSLGMLIYLLQQQLSLCENYAVGQVLTLEQKNGDFLMCITLELMGITFSFQRTANLSRPCEQGLRKPTKVCFIERVICD